jgi:ssDNA-binding Zn-finger/Zn-ribbon topoisomerase 1
MKTIKRLKWEKKLTARELKHVRENCGKTLFSFKETRRQQKAGADACFDCRFIARKLGLEE